MTKEQFEDITKWQDETFGSAHTLSKAHHLHEEVEELIAEIMVKNSGVSVDPDRLRLEFADCFILLFGSAASAGMSYEDICRCINDKMEINKSRVWGEPDANGVINHINTDSNEE